MYTATVLRIFSQVRRFSVLDGRLVLPDGRLRDPWRNNIPSSGGRARTSHRRRHAVYEGETRGLAVEPDGHNECTSSSRLVDGRVWRPQQLHHTGYWSYMWHCVRGCLEFLTAPVSQWRSVSLCILISLWLIVCPMQSVKLDRHKTTWVFVCLSVRPKYLSLSIATAVFVRSSSNLKCRSHIWQRKVNSMANNTGNITRACASIYFQFSSL